MLKNTLVVVVGEFGRTPKIETNNGISGRSHWPACFSAVLAGAGIGGSVYGASDKIGALREGPSGSTAGSRRYPISCAGCAARFQIGGASDHHGRADPRVVQLSGLKPTVATAYCVRGSFRSHSACMTITTSYWDRLCRVSGGRSRARSKRFEADSRYRLLRAWLLPIAFCVHDNNNLVLGSVVPRQRRKEPRM